MIDMKYAERISDVIIQEVMGRSKNYDRSMIADFETKREHLIGEIILKLWDKLLECHKYYYSRQGYRQSEKALACLIRKGVNKNRLNFQGTTAFIPLSSLTYRIVKENPGFSCLPCIHTWTWTHPMSSTIFLPEEKFADFLFEFDSYVGPVIGKIDKHLLEIKALAMQYSIICQTANNLGEQYLRPNGISWSVGTDIVDDSVFISFSKEGLKNLWEKIRLDELAKVFSEIPGKMTKQPELPREKPRRRFFDDLSLFKLFSDNDDKLIP